jgi:hypothetical protein
MHYIRHAAALSLFVLAVAPASAGARSGPTSCPLSTEVYPFPELSLDLYQVELTDGGPGDADNAVDDACLFRTRLCFGSAAATPEACQAIRLDRVTVVAGGRLDPAVRSATVNNVVDGISQLFGGPEIDDNTIFLDDAPLTNGQCVEVPVRVPAPPGVQRRLRLRCTLRGTTESGVDANFSGRLWLNCHPRPDSGETKTRCSTYGRDCTTQDVPLPPGVPGDRPPSGSPPLAPTPPVPNSPPTGKRLFYISPSGNDGNAGTSQGAPWRTFDRALNSSKPLRPGDTLVLLDGTYTRTTTGLPRIDCGNPGTASNGEGANPITIRALNEHRALLQSDGLAPSFEMSDCSWWIVSGLRAKNADNAGADQNSGYPFRFLQVSNVTGARLLGSHNNRRWNTHIFAVELSQNVLLEECEAYYFHRHAFSIWRSRYVDVRRCYANSMRYGTKGCCSGVDNRDFGDEAFSLYGTSDSIIENSISENESNGFQIHGIASPLDPSGHGGRNNRILGSLSLEDSVPSLIESRGSSGTYHNASGNVFQNFLAGLGSGHGIFLRGTANSVAENVTLYGSTEESGLVADDSGGGSGGTCSRTSICASTGESCTLDSDCSTGVCTQNSDGCSFTARNVLAANNRVYGFRSTEQKSWLVEYSNAAGNAENYSPSETLSDKSGSIRSSLSTTPTGVGIGAGKCLPWILPSSNMARAGQGGGPLGATILYRYENGTLTSKPLWNAATGAFPCGATVGGVSDGTKRCSNLHTRLGIGGGGGCQFPQGY